MKSYTRLLNHISYPINPNFHLEACLVHGLVSFCRTAIMLLFAFHVRARFSPSTYPREITNLFLCAKAIKTFLLSFFSRLCNEINLNIIKEIQQCTIIVVSNWILTPKNNNHPLVKSAQQSSCRDVKEGKITITPAVLHSTLRNFQNVLRVFFFFSCPSSSCRHVWNLFYYKKNEIYVWWMFLRMEHQRQQTKMREELCVCEGLSHASLPRHFDLNIKYSIN